MTKTTVHPLTAADAHTLVALGARRSPLKGKLTRASFDALMEEVPDVPGIQYSDDIVGGVGGVWCRPQHADGTILFLHGGAYMAGTAHAYRHFVGHVAAAAKMNAFVPDYRLAPEHRFPAALDDAHAAYVGLASGKESPVAIVGDSAGGGLTLALASDLRDARAPLAAVALSPVTDLGQSLDSLSRTAELDLLLTAESVAHAARTYLKGHDPRDPRASAVYAETSALPPVLLHVGTSELLLDDSRRYAARAEVTLHEWEGMPHVFLSDIELEAAREAIEITGAFLRDAISR